MCRGYSQNFLVDESISHQITVEADIQPGVTIFEIGPGALDAPIPTAAIEVAPRLNEPTDNAGIHNPVCTCAMSGGKS